MKEGRSTTWLLAALSAVFLYFCYLIFRPYAAPILFALVVAIVFHPLHRYSQRIFRNPSMAALASMLAALVLAALPLFFVGMAVSNELSAFYQTLAAKSAGQGGPIAYLAHALQEVTDWLGKYLPVPSVDIHAAIMKRLGEASATLVRFSAGLVGNIVTLLTNAIIASIVLFFVFRDGQALLRRVSSELPLGEQRFQELQDRISSTVIANFYGGVAVGAAQGTLTALAFWALGISSPVLWGVVTAVFSLVPMFGSAVVWVPASVILLFSGHVIKGLILLGLGAGVIGLADNVIRPWIIGETVRLHTIYVFFALLGGVQVFGVMGLFLGPVILSVTAALLSMLREEFRAQASVAGR